MFVNGVSMTKELTFAIPPGNPTKFEIMVSDQWLSEPNNHAARHRRWMEVHRLITLALDTGYEVSRSVETGEFIGERIIFEKVGNRIIHKAVE